MNIPTKKIIAKIGSKEINIKTDSQEKVHDTVILWIIADVTKLSQILEFKGTQRNNWEKKNSKVPYNQRTKDFCILSTKGFEKWVNNKTIDIWSLEKYSHFDIKKRFYACNWWYIHA